jgi:hypothetical protein
MRLHVFGPFHDWLFRAPSATPMTVIGYEVPSLQGANGVDAEEATGRRAIQAGQVGGLPLLQFALDRLWRQQVDG